MKTNNKAKRQAKSSMFGNKDALEAKLKLHQSAEAKPKNNVPKGKNFNKFIEEKMQTLEKDLVREAL